MFDFRLQVFNTVAKRLSFTKAAEELFITQPAVTKHIHEIESHFKTALFERNGNKIKLTTAGQALLQHTETLFALYRNIEFDMHALTQSKEGNLRIGASNTVSQYILPPVISAFRQKFKHISISLTTANTEQTEEELLNRHIDLGMIEGRSKKSGLKYTPSIEDELVLVAAANSPFAAKRNISANELVKMPLVLREQGSGTLEVILHALKPLGLRLPALTVDVQLDNSESIKNYLLQSGSMAFLSLHAIAREVQQNQLAIINVKGLSIKRHFYFIQRQGPLEELPALFKKFTTHYNFK